MTDSEQPPPKSKDPFTWQLMLSVVGACMGTAALGADLAYSSPAITDINGRPNPFHLDTFQVSLASSVIGLGACIGSPLIGCISDAFGRRHMLILATLPLAASYVVIAASTSPHVFIFGRFLTGLFVGVFDDLPGTYISEISPPHLRGRLISLTGIFKALGFTYVFGLGAVLPWNWLSVSCSLLSVISAVLLLFMFESPRWLLRQKQIEGATVALKWLRGESSALVAEEINDISVCIRKSKMARKTLGMKTMIQPQFYRPFILVSVLMMLMQLVGVTAMSVHSVTVFRDNVSESDPFVLSVVASVFSLLGCVVCLLVVDRYGRKPLLIASCAVIMVSLTCLGLFLKFRDSVAHLSFSGYIPSACLMCYSFAGRLGVVPVPFILVGELFPLHYRGLVSGISGSIVWLFVFLSSLVFSYATLYLHDYGTFWCMAGFALLGILVTIYFVPETKGKTLEQIELNYHYTSKPSKI